MPWTLKKTEEGGIVRIWYPDGMTPAHAIQRGCDIPLSAWIANGMREKRIRPQRTYAASGSREAQRRVRQDERKAWKNYEREKTNDNQT